METPNFSLQFTLHFYISEFVNILRSFGLTVDRREVTRLIRRGYTDTFGVWQVKNPNDNSEWVDLETFCQAYMTRKRRELFIDSATRLEVYKLFETK